MADMRGTSRRATGPHLLAEWTRLFPESPAIQVVAIDGEVLGHVWYNGRRWIATEKGLAGPVAECDTFRDALLALACEAEPW